MGGKLIMKLNYNPQDSNNYQETQPNNLYNDYQQNYQPNYQQTPTYPQNSYQPNNYNKPNNTLGILSIVLGIFIPLVGIILGIIGINKAKTTNSNKLISIIGIIISIVMMIFYGIIFVILLMFGDGGIRGFGHYSSRGYGNSSYSSVIEDYYIAYNDRNEDKANKCFPYGSTTTVDFSNAYGEFDTNTINNTYKSSEDIDKYNKKFDMKFDDVSIYESISLFVYDSDPGMQSDYKLEFTIGEYNDTYFILKVEDLGMVSDVEEENIEIVEDLPTIEDITETTTEATTEVTTETSTEVITETTTETSLFEGETLGNDKLGYIDISKATEDKFTNTTSENIFNASVDGVTNYQFYSNLDYTININMYEVDNINASIDTIATTYKEEYEKQLAQIDTENTSNVVTQSNCMIGNSDSDYYKEGKLLWFQLQDDTLSKLGYGSLYSNVYLWEDEGNLYMIEIVYTNSSSEEIVNKIIQNYHK
jgi:hypothetical protein